MAVVIKNTFLDVADHKFLYFEEPCCFERRCQSLPRAWKPATPCYGSRKRTLSRQSSSSTQSDLSFCSTVDSFEVSEDASAKHQSEIPGAAFRMHVIGNLDSPHTICDESVDGAGSTCQDFNCATPASSLDSPCEAGKATEMDMASCSLINQKVNAWEWFRDCDGGSVESEKATKTQSDGTTQPVVKTDQDNAHPWNSANRTKLKSEAPAFQPMAKDTRLDTVANAIYLALVSSGQTCQVKIEKGVQGTLPTVISAELQNGPRSSSRCYDVISLARQTVEEITTRMDTVTLLSKRVQKEDRGYSLRSSIACVQTGAECGMCWDLFHKGYCPRRCNCQWYHPQESDIAKIKVSIRCTDDATARSSEDQLPTSLPAARHKISLGQLV